MKIVVSPRAIIISNMVFVRKSGEMFVIFSGDDDKLKEDNKIVRFEKTQIVP